MSTYGHRVESYHGDNSRNGTAKNINKRLNHSARTSLLHAIRKWPGVITTALWPFAYKPQDESHNHLELNTDGLSPIEVLLGHKEEIAAEDFHTWGCPIYVLDSTLQTWLGIEPPKWDPLPRVGVYLVSYLQFDKEPPSWATLVAEHSAKATEEAFIIASSWYEGEDTNNREAAS
eukprot:6447834-Ditylum_brightwellii.AAC.2